MEHLSSNRPNRAIYGAGHFEKVKKNDINKIQKCIDNNISVFVIDTSDQKNLINDQTCNKYYVRVVNLIRYYRYKLDQTSQMEFRI